MAKKRMAEVGKGARHASETEVVGTSALDVGALRQIVEILEASDVTRLSWRSGRERLFIRRGSASADAPMVSTATPGVMVMPPPSAPTLQQAAAMVNNPAPAQPAPVGPSLSSSSAAAAASKPGNLVTSPFVGTFYRTPAPDQPPFVEVGSTVKKGQVLCIIEAMKLMNEIEAEAGGKVAEILVENGMPVEFGQPLFRLEPA